MVILAINGMVIFNGCLFSVPEIGKYAVSVAGGIQNGSITANPSRADAGKTVTLTISPDNDDYRIQNGSLSVKQSGELPVVVLGGGDTFTFVMPASNVTVSVEFEGKPPLYSASIAREVRRGSFRVVPSYGVEGSTITLTVRAESGYLYLDGSLTVRQTDGTPVTVFSAPDFQTFTFTMPASSVIVSGEFIPISAGIFTVDVTQGIQYGSISANPTRATMGSMITLTIRSQSGYYLPDANLNVRQANGSPVTVYGNGVIRTFAMPPSNVTVNGGFIILPAGSVEVEFAGFGDEDIDITRNNQNDIYLFRYLVVYVNGVYDSYQWYINGDERWGETNSSIRISGGDVGVGVHHLTAIVTKDGVPYSKELVFTVR